MKQKRHIHKQNTTLFVGLMAVILLVSLVARVVFLHSFPWGYDEGIHALLARLLATGFKPYSELFVSYPPLFVWSLEYPWRIWQSVEALQLTMTIYSFLGVIAVGYVAYRLGGFLPGAIAAILLSFGPTYLDGSRAIMTEVPSIGVAALSVAFAAQYVWSNQRKWLALSGIVFSASLMLKILSPFLVGLIPLMIVAHRWREHSNGGRIKAETIKAMAIDALLWGGLVLMPVILVGLMYDVREMYRQVIQFRIDTRAAFADDRMENMGMLLSFFGENSFQTILALLAVVGTAKRKASDNGRWFVILWLGLAIIFALIQVPLRPKHLPLLLPPLTILAGLGVSDTIHWASRLKTSGHRIAGFAGYSVAVLLVAGCVGNLWLAIAPYRQVTAQTLSTEEQILLAYIQKFTAPTDCIISDNPSLIFYSGRLTPPELSEVSSARLRSGYLTADMLIRADEDFNCQIIAPVARRLKRSTPDFIEWAKQNYRGLWLYDGQTEVFLAKPLTAVETQHPLTANFDNQVQLVGYDLTSSDKSVAYVTLYWKVLHPLQHDYTVFVHVRDADNQTRINGDHQPYDGRVPTSQWRVGDIIKDTIQLHIPSDVPVGTYKIFTGMYVQQGSEFLRLPLVNDTSGENAVIIPEFMVVGD